MFQRSGGEDMKTEYSVTCVQEQGPRSYQEDRSFCKPIKGSDFNGWLLAVMDGHGGASVAELCAKEIEHLFTLHGAEHTEEALRDLVSSLNVKTSHLQVGSTLSVACILEDHKKVSIAVLGDSPVVVLDSTGQLHVGPEHNVRSNVNERKAAEKRGGAYSGGYIWRRDRNYGLQMSRALGDAHLEGIISHEPEVYTVTNPKWILIASDGLVDPGHDQSEHLFSEIKEYAEKNATASDLMQWAVSRELRDNATAIVWK